MYKSFLLLVFFTGGLASAQVDTTRKADTIIREEDSVVIDSMPENEKQQAEAIKVFQSPRLINGNTVEVFRRGILDFRVTHNFGDIAGDDGGIERFFGLDNAADVRIGFTIGVSDRFNIIAARDKGFGAIKQMWELGLKYQILQQMNDGKHPVAMTIFTNIAASSMKAASDSFPNLEYSFDDFGDRLSQVVQLMIARKFGPLSLQLNPTLVHRNFVITGDDNTIFALGGAGRIPLSKKFVLIFDYFHPFRSDESKATFKAQGIKFHDALGVGLEILTEGHVFHLNFTNATEILENRFIPATITSWGDGQYRWGFSISRKFVLFRNKEEKALYK